MAYFTWSMTLLPSMVDLGRVDPRLLQSVKLSLYSWLWQGTSLPKEVAEQLDDMFEHEPLGAAAAIIKRQYKKLRKWQGKLGHMEYEANQQMNGVIHKYGLLAAPSSSCAAPNHMCMMHCQADCRHALANMNTRFVK